MIATPSEAVATKRLPGRVRVAQDEAEFAGDPGHATGLGRSPGRSDAVRVAAQEKLVGVLWWLDGQDEFLEFGMAGAHPEWHEPVAGDGDYAINTTFDLRFGTFAHPWEDSLCVWGADLLAEIQDELDAVLPRLRTGGRVNRAG